MEQPMFSLIEMFVNYMATIVLTIMTLILGRKVIKEKRETGNLNIVRFLILGVYASMSWTLIWELLYDNTPLQGILSEELIVSTETFSFFYFGAGLSTTFCLSMVCYANRWVSLYYSPTFVYGGMVIIFLLTGYSGLLTPYIYIGAAISLLFLYVTGFRLKDSGAFGLAIMCTLAFSALVFAGNIIGLTMNLVYPVFGIIYASGHFNPFKEGEVYTEDE